MVEQTQECDVQTIDTYIYSINGDVVEQKELNGSINKFFEQQIEGRKPLDFSSCKEILDAGISTGDGTYILIENGNSYSTNCDMTNGGLTQIDNSLFDINKIKNEEQIVKATNAFAVNGVPINSSIISITYNNITQNILKSVTSPNTFNNYQIHASQNTYAINGYIGYSYIDSHNYFGKIGYNVNGTNYSYEGTIVFSNGFVGKIFATSNGAADYIIPNHPLYANGEPAYIYYNQSNYTLWKK